MSRKRKATAAAAMTVTSMAITSTGSSTAMVAGLTVSPYFANKSQTRHVVSSSSFMAASKDKNDTTNASSVSRTSSFEPLWTGSLFPDSDTPPRVHTLIVGTHPSIASLAQEQYFGHTMNAFWWIAGDCLNFRRASGISPSSGEPYKLSASLRYGPDQIIPYEEQVRVLTSKGFALWDVVQSCERKGSLDVDIKNEVPNDIRGFCEKHPTVERIVLANGGTQCTLFARHFKSWWESGELMPAENETSIKAFKRFAKKTNNFENGKIKCVCALGVSPAAALYSYEQKRDFWEQYCYEPGLKNHEIYESKSLS